MNSGKRKYVRRAMTNDRIINEITKIRRKNNIAWMTLLKLAFASKPRQAKKIMGEITTNDQLVTKWMGRLSARQKKR